MSAETEESKIAKKVVELVTDFETKLNEAQAIGQVNEVPKAKKVLKGDDLAQKKLKPAFKELLQIKYETDVSAIKIKDLEERCNQLKEYIEEAKKTEEISERCKLFCGWLQAELVKAREELAKRKSSDGSGK